MAHSIPNRQKPGWKPIRKPLAPPRTPPATGNGKNARGRKDQAWKKEP
ncbi:MAG: hypothetical protein ABSA30_02785 [Candidatus Aminicenantales bacterium]|jgi:hypothetical protein